MKTIVWFGFVLGAVSVAGKVFFTQPQQKVTLECGINSNSGRLVWRRGEEQIITVNGRSGLQRKGTQQMASRSRVLQGTKLEISQVKEADAGPLSCEADRIIHDHTLAVVSVSASPSSEPTSGDSVKLHCQVHGLTTGYTVQWKRPDGTTATESAPGTVDLKSVAPSDAGDWMCIINPDGPKYTLKLTVTEPTPAPAPPPTQRSKDKQDPSCADCNTVSQGGINQLQWWVWVAVGVGCLVVVLLIIFVIVMCKRIRRKKRKFLEMKNARPKKYCQCNRPAAAARPVQGRRKQKPATLHMQPLLTE